jgi:cysteine synthase B
MGETLQGLRSLSEGYVPPLLDLNQLSRRFLVDNATAIDTTHQIIEKEGIFAGVSSGATLHAAMRVAQGLEEGNIVVMFSDGGWKYLPARPWDAAREGSKALDETHWW